MGRRRVLLALTVLIFEKTSLISLPVIGDRGLLDFIVWVLVTLDHPRVLDGSVEAFSLG
ncbi:MAG: hypothetical protein QW096_12730 [Thermofilaceae archaeon]